MRVLIFLLILPLMALGNDECPEAKKFPNVDLRSEFGPLRSQDSIGWCFAYSTTDLLSHWLYKNYHGKSSSSHFDTRQGKNMISAVWASALYYKSKRRDHINQIRNHVAQRKELVSKYNQLWEQRNKLFAQATFKTLSEKSLSEYFSLVQQIEKQGLSKEQEIKMANLLSQIKQKKKDNLENSELQSLFDKLNKNGEEIIALQNEFSKLPEISLGELEAGVPFEMIKLLVSNDNGLCQESEIPSDDVVMAQNFKKDIKQLTDEIYLFLSNPNPSPKDLECSISAAQKLFPKATREEISWILRKYRDQEDPILKLAEASCKKKILLDKNLSLPQMIVIQEPNFEGKIKDYLAQGTPVEIIYFSIKAFTPKAYWTQLGSKAEIEHSSVLVGQRYNCQTHKVEFILRNSFPKEECSLNLRLYEGKNEKPPYRCEADGHFVIPESHLKKFLVPEAFVIVSQNQK